MWQSTPINPSKCHIIKRFDILVSLAKIMKGCHFYYACPERQALYGISEEVFGIRELVLPPEVELTYPILFRYDTINIDIMNKYIDFLLLDDIPWALLPIVYKDDLINIMPKWKPINEASLWAIENVKTGLEIDYIDLYGPEGRKSVMLPNIMTVINGFLNSRYNGIVSDTIKTFYNMHQNPIIADVLANKVSMGEKYVSLDVYGKSYGFFMFKNLFPINKDDVLDIKVRNRLDNYNLFELEFVVKHKKNTLKYILQDQFVESTYSTFIHVD